MFIKYMSSMFSAASSLTDISALANWDTSSVTDMTSMFEADERIASLSPIFGWTIQQSTIKVNMFDGIPDTVQRPDWYQ